VDSSYEQWNGSISRGLSHPEPFIALRTAAGPQSPLQPQNKTLLCYGGQQHQTDWLPCIRSIRLIYSVQYTVCTKAQSAVIQPFLLPGIQQQLSQTHAHWEGEHQQALLSSEHIQEAGEQAETIKKEKILNHALTVHVQIAGWSLVHLKRPVNTALTVTNRENKQWGRTNKQLA